jgi:outer membrane lipoprotein-sorting protein
VKRLRTIPTSRLLALCLAVIAVGATGVAIAAAAVGGGPTPAPKPLAQAVRDALAAPDVPGITARIEFTNKLIDSSSLQGSDPILSGATGRLWLGSDHRLRLELQSDGGDAQIVSDGTTVSVYDHAMNTAYTATLPKSADKAGDKPDAPPTLATIEQDLAKLMQEADVSGATPSTVAGRPAYTVRIGPKHAGGLLGAAELAWDAERGVPLRVAVYAHGSSAPVLELKVTDITFGAVPASRFDVSPPAGAKTVTVDLAGKADGADAPAGAAHESPAVTGPAAVANALPFTLNAPAELVGLPRHEVRLLDWQGHPAALVTYGAGLGGIAVIEQAADTAATTPPSGKDHHGEGPGLSLPKVKIGDVTGEELDTALGTMLRFTRNGVAYTVIGSVPATAAEAAARAL